MLGIFNFPGQHYAHTGVYGLFSYAHEAITGMETFPIQIEGQKDPFSPCYEMGSKELVFVFHPPNEEKTSSFSHDPSQYIWKYEAQFITGEIFRMSREESGAAPLFRLFSSEFFC